MYRPSVSVIVPVFNGEMTIGKTLDAILNQSYAGRVEIIVVDDGSKDNTNQIVTNYSSVRYFVQQNAGPAAARNKGAKEAKGDILFFTDSDCVPEREWIEKMVVHLEDPSVWVVSGSYDIANPSSLLASCIQNEIRYRHERLMPKFPKSFGSYNFCVIKKVFEEAGGFNSAYPAASGEDNDLSYKIIKSGQRILFEKYALVKHYHQSRLGNYLKEQFRHGYWRVKMYRDHPKMMRGDDYTFWKDILEVPAVAFTILGVFALPLMISSSDFMLWLVKFWLSSFLVFEILFACWIMPRIPEAIFFGLVMFLRAFARTFGFLSALLRFPAEKT